MALAVSPVLTLPIALGGLGVGLPVLAGIIGISSAPFLLAVPADLQVLGIGLEHAAVVFLAALPLAIRPAANKLVGVVTGKLKDLLAVATAAITHHVGLRIRMRALYCEQRLINAATPSSLGERLPTAQSPRRIQLPLATRLTQPFSHFLTRGKAPVTRHR